jgi:nicotinate-nucleotide adenylyltransferase
MRIGLFGGTFDPPHIGHLILAEVMVDVLGLDRVWFVPAADPPHKQHRDKTPVEHRLAMLELALDGNPAFQLSRIDIDRDGPHYTVEMVALARASCPADDFWFLMGSDSCMISPAGTSRNVC